jgi:hypothetical protein
MNQISIRQTRVSLFLISLTFLAMSIELVICQLEFENMPSMSLFNLLILYLFSLFLPAVGLLVFMKNTRRTSSRWYWGIPLFLGLVLNTFLRDAMFMNPFDSRAVNLVYGQPFIANFLTLYDFLVNPNIMFLISSFFSVSTALFCLSVPEGKRKKFMLPFALSLIAVLSNLIQFMVGWAVENHALNISFSSETMSISYYSFVIFSVAIFFIGLYFIVIADSF